MSPRKKKKVADALNALFSSTKNAPESVSPDKQETSPPAKETNRVTATNPIPAQNAEKTKSSTKAEGPPMPQARGKPSAAGKGNPDLEQGKAKGKNETQDYLQMVVCSLAGEYFGLDINKVESIIKMQEITPVPYAYDYVVGVTNLRGTVLPVINLRKRFAMPACEDTQNTRIIVHAAGAEKIGLIVDSVSEVIRIPLSAIEAPPPLISKIETDFISGIAKVTGNKTFGENGNESQQTDDHLVICLDLQKALSTVN